MNRISLSLLGLALAGACAHNRPAASGPPPPPTAEERYATLPDTTVCVVDRTTRRGLRPLDAKVEPSGQVVVLVSGRVQTLEDLHPISPAAGYAAREAWVTAGTQLTIQGRRYEKVGPPRLIPLEQLERSGEYRSIPLFSDPKDTPPPRAFYVPLRPGCVFQAYARSDLLQ
jgi:hypothetical protein